MLPAMIAEPSTVEMVVRVLFLFGYGLFRMQWRKRQRKQRMTADHVR